MSFSAKLFDEMSSVRLDDDESKQFSILVSQTDTVAYTRKFDGLSKEQVLEVIASQKACEELMNTPPRAKTVHVTSIETSVSLDMVFKDGEPWFADQEK